MRSYDSNICKKSIEQAIIKLENVDAIIIFNGFGKYGKTSEMDLSTVESMVSANLLVPYYAIHYILKHFIQNKKGHIIVLGSVAGLKYSPNFAMYSATKFALRALIEGVRNEIQEYNIRTTNIQPGFVSTKFWDEFGENNSPFQYDPQISVTPEEISKLIDEVLNTSKNFVINEVTCRSVKQER